MSAGEDHEVEQYATEESAEHELVTALRRDPRDAETRQVYADWLEQHGFETRAKFLRIEGGAADEAEREVVLHALAAETPLDRLWRAVTSRAPLECDAVNFAYHCPKRWDALTPTRSDVVRHCSVCAKPVYFCATLDEVRARGARRECVAIDASLVRRDVASLLAAAREPDLEPMMGRIMIPADPDPRSSLPPRSPEPRKGILSRIAALFRR